MRRPLLLLALVVVAVACGSDDGSGPPSTAPSTSTTATPTSTTTVAPSTTSTTTVPDSTGERARLEAALQRWMAASLTDYEFELMVQCECLDSVSGPFAITVRNGEVVSVEWLLGDGAGEPVLTTIDEAFGFIAAALDAGTPVDIDYDDALGLPVSVVIDPEAVAVDGGLAFTIANVRKLEPGGVLSGLALAGPQCPVEKDPPDPACADKPVAGAVIEITRPDKSVVSVTTGEDGTFLIRLAPGEYLVTPRPVEGLLGTAPPVAVVVEAGRTVSIELGYDTGIR